MQSRHNASVDGTRLDHGILVPLHTQRKCDPYNTSRPPPTRTTHATDPTAVVRPAHNLNRVHRKTPWKTRGCSPCPGITVSFTGTTKPNLRTSNINWAPTALKVTHICLLVKASCDQIVNTKPRFSVERDAQQIPFFLFSFFFEKKNNVQRERF